MQWSQMLLIENRKFVRMLKAPKIPMESLSTAKQLQCNSGVIGSMRELQLGAF